MDVVGGVLHFAFFQRRHNQHRQTLYRKKGNGRAFAQVKGQAGQIDHIRAGHNGHGGQIGGGSVLL